ncbi:extracellular solute-binding protein [Paenibacillus camerounensis]|uniref:extracellular solute-binding protein n=1 Tax=Paenibacillus camerounensis TaxID=1243663 RepID=UPI0005A9D434|nr:extracellular solute-binding protein [Paenibacillus camerounensis]
MRKMLTLTLAIILILAGCSSNENDSQGNVANPDNSEFNTIQFGSAIDVNNSNALKLKDVTGEIWEDNRWTDLFKEKLKIDTKYKLMTPAGQYEQKLRLAITSNDLPDIFQAQNLTDMRQLAEGEAIQELGPIYDEYASPLLKSIIEAEGKEVFSPGTFNGKVYGIPVKMPSTNGYNHLWIREDWLNKLGLKRPQTIEDVYNIAKAFTENDPDGNNTNDTIGLTMNKDFLSSWAGMSGLFWGYGAYPEFWIKDTNGQITNGSIQDNIKEPLRLLAKMYKEGLVDKEFGSKDFNKANELLVSGKAGMFYGPHWFAGFADNSKQNDPNAKWITVPLPTKEGVDIKIPLNIATDGFYVVRSDFEHPEKLVELLNLYVETLFSEEADLSKWWTEGDIDFVWQTAPIYTLKPSLDIEAHVNMKEAINNGTTDQLTGIAKGFYESIQRGSGQMELMFGPTDTPFEFVASTYPDQILWNEWQNAPTATQTTAGSSLSELVYTSFTKIVMGEVDVDAGFEKFVNDWNKIGGEKIIQEINEAKGN